MNADEDRWITVNGTHVPIGEDGRPQGEVGEKIVSDAEKQRKIDSIKINFSGDTELPRLNAETLQELGIEDKPVLLKKGILEKNKKNHPEVDSSEYSYIIGRALYRPDAVIPGHNEKPYYNFISRTSEGKSAITLLDTGANSYEVVNFHMISNRQRRQKEKQG
jgi:hypothetical protein